MFSIHKADKILSHTSFLFPGGEVGVKLDVSDLDYKHIVAPYQTIVARLQSPKDIMELCLLADALQRFDFTPIHLFLPYVPYGRQDRICVAGESFSIKVFADIVNGLNFDRVTIIDPHSDVIGAVFDNLEIVTQLQVVNRFQSFLAFMTTHQENNRLPILVSPDTGANKKTATLAGYFGHHSFVRADKLRDLSTGAIKETIVYAERDKLEGQIVVIADDICDGGKTFIELAKVLKERGTAKVVLYVTHGIFSKGLSILKDGGIDHVYTTDSFPSHMGDNTDFLTILELNKEFI